MKSLEELRQELNVIDDEITQLYVKRMQVVKDVAQAKNQVKKEVNDVERENSIIYRLTKDVPEDMKLYVKEIYKTIFRTSKSYQTTLMNRSSKTSVLLEEILKGEVVDMPVCAAVACQGVKGANSGTVAKKIFPISELTYFKNFEGVFSAVEKGLCEYGVLPIENSTAGSVLEVYDLMKKHNFYIVRSVRARIEHSLVAKKQTDISNVKKVISHSQALSQCSEYLKKLGVQIEAVENTAIAAQMVANSDDNTIAALCSSDCAEIYGLKILEKSVQDATSNFTRFICISKTLQVYKGADWISIMMGISHNPGSLNNVIGKFSSLGLNLVKIESRPIPNSEFEFLFYFDFEGDVGDVKVRNLIAELENDSDKFVFLGAYKEII